MTVIHWFQSLSLVTILVIVASIFAVTLLLFVFLTLKAKMIAKLFLCIIPLLLIYFVFKYFLVYSLTIHLVIAIPSILISIFLLIAINKGNKKGSIWSVKIPLKNGKFVILDNIRRGVAIFGSAGCGKTESVFVPIIKHAAENEMPCLCYDYKNGELTEIANYFYASSKIKKSVIIPHAPLLSDRINPFLPKYICNEQHLRQQTKVIFANLKRGDRAKNDSDSFFDKIPESTLAAVIWRLKEDFPQFCTLPHAVAFCLSSNPRQIAAFISQNIYSSAIGRPLIDSLISENQVAGVKASLSLPLTDLAIPSIFWVMSANEVDLDINNPDNPTFLSIVTDPQLEKVNGPFISLIISTVISNMQVRDRLPSLLLFDEGTTFSIDHISRIPATMRSFNIATIFSTQDKALAKEAYGDTITNSLLANLSYQVIGKTNDPESVRYYKQISEEIEKTQLSKSYKNSFAGGSDTRYSESTRDTSKYKNQDFTGLQPGQFFVFADGKDHKYNLAQIPYSRIENKVKHHVSDQIINSHFKKIFDEAKSLIN